MDSEVEEEKWELVSKSEDIFIGDHTHKISKSEQKSISFNLMVLKTEALCVIHYLTSILTKQCYQMNLLEQALFISIIPESLRSQLDVKKAFTWFVAFSKNRPNRLQKHPYHRPSPTIFKWAWLCQELHLRCRLVCGVGNSALLTIKSLASVQLDEDKFNNADEYAKKKQKIISEKAHVVSVWSEVYDPIDHRWIVVSFHESGKMKSVFDSPIETLQYSSLYSFQPFLLLAFEHYAKNVNSGIRNAIQSPSAENFFFNATFNHLHPSYPTRKYSSAVMDVTLRYTLPLEKHLNLGIVMKRSSIYRQLSLFLASLLGKVETEEMESWIHQAMTFYQTSKKPLKAFQSLFIIPSMLGVYYALPPHSEPIGTTVQTGDSIYLLSDVARVRSIEGWRQLGMEVISSEQATKYHRNIPLYGIWQVQRIQPPTLTMDGKIPRNVHGTLDMFQPWMVPQHCIHLYSSAASYILKNSGIDAVDAVVRFKFQKGGVVRPIIHGIIVLKKDLSTIFHLLLGERRQTMIRNAISRSELNAERWRWLARKSIALLSLSVRIGTE